MQLLMHRFVITGQNMRQGLDRFTLASTYYVIIPKCNEGQKLHTINNDLLTWFDFWNFYRVNHSQASILSIRVKNARNGISQIMKVPDAFAFSKILPVIGSKQRRYWRGDLKRVELFFLCQSVRISLFLQLLQNGSASEALPLAYV